VAQHRILLVDDDAISLEILASMLNCDGHEVLQAADGEEALHLLAEPDSSASPDVLLVDMQMPGISGGELAERVRAMRGPKPRLLAMSATTVKNHQLRGFDGFLLKPLGLDDLRRALEAAPALTDAGRRSRQTPNSPRVPESSENINQAVLGKLLKAMPANSLYELYEICIADTRERVVALEEPVRAGRTDEARRGAHQIKGAASMIGAARIARLAAAIELGSCKEGDTLRLLRDLLDACEDLERILLAGKLQTIQITDNQ
jgi:CheY-like chemotaxis protein